MNAQYEPPCLSTKIGLDSTEFRAVLVFALALAAAMCQPLLANARTTVLEAAANPLPNLATSLSETSDMRVFSGILEIGEPYLPGVGAKRIPPSCFIIEIGEIGDASWGVFRIGAKNYWGTRPAFWLQGQSVMLSFGVLHAESSSRKSWGGIAGPRVGYKLLPFGRIVVEPYYETGFAWSKALTPSLVDFHRLGVNLGFRMLRPDF